MTPYALGYRPDPPARRLLARSSRLLLGRSPALPRSASLERFEAPIIDQGAGDEGTGSCIGCGTSQLLRVAAQAHGGDVAKILDFVPSQDGIYKIVRAIERADATPLNVRLPPLGDVGAMPSDLLRVLARYGVRPMGPGKGGRYCDVDVATVNDEPDLGLFEQSGRRLITGEYRIDDRATDAAAQIMAGIAGVGTVGVPPCPSGIGVWVDTAVMEWTPSRGPLDTPPDRRDPNGGGHWLAVTSFDTGHGGASVLRGPNSWSAAWGDRGHFEVTPRWLAAAMSDALVFAIGGAL